MSCMHFQVALYWQLQVFACRLSNMMTLFSNSWCRAFLLAGSIHWVSPSFIHPIRAVLVIHALQLFGLLGIVSYSPVIFLSLSDKLRDFSDEMFNEVCPKFSGFLRACKFEYHTTEMLVLWSRIFVFHVIFILTYDLWANIIPPSTSTVSFLILDILDPGNFTQIYCGLLFPFCDNIFCLIRLQPRSIKSSFEAFKRILMFACTIISVNF